MNFFKTLSAGEFGLAKTAWLFGVLVMFATNKIMGLLPLGISSIIWFGFLAYLLILVPGIWHAADRYDGRFPWAPILGKAYAVLVVCSYLFGTVVLLTSYE